MGRALYIQEKDAETGKQFRYEGYGGHVVYKADGHVQFLERDMLLEIKSMNDGRFKSFEKKGVKLAHPDYYDQVQLGMKLSGFDETLFVAYNKNSSKYWAEVVKRDDDRIGFLEARLHVVMRNGATRSAKSPDDWRCEGCFKKSACWHGALPARACNSCDHSEPTTDGDWWCNLHRAPAHTVCDSWSKYEPRKA